MSAHELFRDQEFFGPERFASESNTGKCCAKLRQQAGHSTDGACNQEALESGLAGLRPQRWERPRHKLTSEVMQFVTQTKTADSAVAD